MAKKSTIDGSVRQEALMESSALSFQNQSFENQSSQGQSWQMQPDGSAPIRLTKHHGLGNDFLIALNPEVAPGPAQAKFWCDRRLGIGADGLIIGTRQNGLAAWVMVLFNADGGRAEISGNGIRCLAQAIAQHTDSSQSLRIQTDAGIRTLEFVVETEGTETKDIESKVHPQGSVAMIKAGMGQASDGPKPSNAWAHLGIEIEAQLGVDIGNPHLVAIVDSFEGVDIAAVGAAVEADYPNGLNVHLVEVASTERIRMLIWERGVGVTQACGSGAVAATWAANQLGKVGRSVGVEMPGGSAVVDLADGEAYLTGPAAYVGEVIVHG